MLNELLMMQAARNDKTFGNLMSGMKTCCHCLLGFMGAVFALVSLISCF